jgi:hypothetical protein
METTMMDQRRFNILIAVLLVSLAASLRILPHPANFAPVAAVAIFGGAVLPRKLAVWAPLAAMIISDAVIGFHDLILVTWVCYTLIALASTYWLKKLSVMRTIALALGSSLFFFVVTNFAVWIKSGMYEHTWNGLAQCYALALPFFRNTALSDLIYTGALFGIYALVTQASFRTLKIKEQNS